MPYIAFDLDALSRVPDAARAAGLAEDALGYGLLRLWAFCFKEKTDTVGSPHLAGFFGVDGDRVATSLVAFRFLDLAPTGGFRVKGAERYLRVRKAQSEAGKANVGNLLKGPKPVDQPKTLSESSSGLSPAGSPAHLETDPESFPGSTPSTEHRAPSTKYPLPSEEGAARPPPPEDVRRDRRKTDKPFELTPPPQEKPRKRSEAQEFWDWAESERARVTGLVRGPEPDPPKLNAWFKRALAECGTVERLASAFGRYVLHPQDDYWRSRGFPFQGFVADNVWRAYVPPEVSNAARNA